jgi:DNA (cytosine-5)-methyltransferase 1
VILDLFAGPGGWSEGLRLLGHHDVGIEWEETACQTRQAAGHATIRADVAAYPRDPFVGAVDGLIASPPCQAFSKAGRRLGLDDIRGQLIFQVIEWAEALQPRWIACEQVDTVLPIWKAMSHELGDMGYKTWYGLLNAADYGVPQTRVRAILMASRDRFSAPPATHTRDPSGEDDMFGDTLAPWVTMADALGWTGKVGFPRVDDLGTSDDGYRTRDWRDADEPAFTVTEKARSWQRKPDLELVPGSWADGRGGNRRTYVADQEPAPTLHFGNDSAAWCWKMPATTVCGDPRITSRSHHDMNGSQGKNVKTTEQVRDGDYEGTEPIKLTIEEAGVLQSFPHDYPWQGGRTKQFGQCGNAVPPVLGAAILKQLL